MRKRAVAAAFWIIGVFVAVTFAGDRPVRQWAVVYLSEPTLIGSTIVQGPVLFTHDDAKMARGERCTTVQLVEPGKGPIEEIAAFHCIPVRRGIVHKFTLRTRPNSELGLGCVLLEYQFAGDAEGHGVPTSTYAH